MSTLAQQADPVIRAMTRVLEEGLTKVLDRAEKIAYASYKRQFDTSGAEFGSPWADLQESTIERKRREGAPAPERILVRTGNLMASVTSPSHGGMARHRKDGVELGTIRDANTGGSLLVAVEKARAVRAAPYGVGGRAVAEIERVWDGYASDLERAFESASRG